MVFSSLTFLNRDQKELLVSSPRPTKRWKKTKMVQCFVKSS